MKVKLLIWFILLQVYTNAQSNCDSQRYISETFSSFDLSSGIGFASADPFGIISNQNLFLDVYEPTGDTLEKRPVIIHKFGGGYVIGWRSEPNIPDFAEKYTNRGFVFISIDYRLGFNALDAESAERAVYRGILDLKSALRFIVDNADTYRIDTSNIFLTGTSAGSISALGQTFMTEADRTPSTFGTLLEPSDLGCVDCSGNTNFNNQEVRIHGIINNWGAVLDTSLIDIVDDPLDNVPVISFHGTNDNAVKYVEGQPFSVPHFPSLQGSFLIHERLENLGIKNSLFPLEGFGHEPQLLNPDLADTIVMHGSNFLYEIMKGKAQTIQGDSSLCLNDTSSYSVAFNPENTYCWDVIGGSIISTNQNNITVYWDTQGMHQIILNENTILDITRTSSLNVFVDLDFDANINFSSDDGLFDFNGNVINNGNYLWNFGNGDFDNGQSVTYQYLDTGSYIVSLTIDNEHCISTDTVVVQSDICPRASFEIEFENSSILLTNNAQFFDSISYNFGDGNFSTSDINSYQYQQEGDYIVQQFVFNRFCVDTFEQSISIIFCSQADFVVSAIGLELSITNNSINSTANFWNFGDNNTSGLFEPSHSYQTPGDYTIELIVFNEELCSDTLRKNINVRLEEDSITSIFTIDEDLIEIHPNPFSDKIKISYKTDKIYSIILYNILGEKLEEFKNNQGLLNLSHLSKGLYFVSFVHENQKYSYKIVKQ